MFAEKVESLPGEGLSLFPYRKSDNPLIASAFSGESGE